MKLNGLIVEELTGTGRVAWVEGQGQVAVENGSYGNIQIANIWWKVWAYREITVVVVVLI